jgi:hypothetical protein
MEKVPAEHTEYAAKLKKMKRVLPLAGFEPQMAKPVP